MGLFGKRISDEKWKRAVIQGSEITGGYGTLQSRLEQFEQAVLDDNLALQDTLTGMTVGKKSPFGPPPLPALLKFVTTSPGPTSPEARKAKKQLESGLREFNKAMEQGQKVRSVLSEGLAARTQMGGMTGGMATKRADLLISSWKLLVMSARSKLIQVSEFLDQEDA